MNNNIQNNIGDCVNRSNHSNTNNIFCNNPDINNYENCITNNNIVDVNNIYNDYVEDKEGIQKIEMKEEKEEYKCEHCDRVFEKKIH